MASPTTDELYQHVSFPLPYRVLFLTGLGILGWATNLHGLDASGVDVVAAMDLRTDAQLKPITPALTTAFNYTKVTRPYRTVYRIFVAYSAFSFFSWLFFRVITRGDPALVDVYGYVPMITALVILITLILPRNILYRREREKFTHAIRRCLFPHSNGPIYFSDVVLADIGTSFAKVFGDVWQCLWMLKPGNSILTPPVDDSWLRWILPTMMCVPFFIRFRQCIVEYTAPGNESQRPLFNALKYATSFPVIILSAAQRLVIADLVKERGRSVFKKTWHGEHPLFRLWLLAAVVNSLYSFWWDVTNDWGLEVLKIQSPQNHDRHSTRPLSGPRLYSGTPLLFREGEAESFSSRVHQDYSDKSGDNPRHRYRQSCVGLRRVILYPRVVYPFLIFVDLLLRMTWSVKLSPHVQSPRDGSIPFFWLEVTELVRRWLWVFIRVEWEVVKKGQDAVRLPEDRNDSGFEMVPSTLDDATG